MSGCQLIHGQSENLSRKWRNSTYTARLAAVPDERRIANPHSTAQGQGRDPQLEKGVEVALQELKDHPVPPIKRPKYPVYNWQKVRAEAAKGQTTSGSGSGERQ